MNSKGEVYIDGHHIRKEQQIVRNKTGICPQNNVYFKYLTLREHLILFGELKRILRQRSDGYTGQQLIKALDLELDLNKEAIKLSGGTLRRMVLAIALIGANDVLLLDEPTAALDPKIRRKVWDLIIDSRKSKTILITSHHLEEANLLSDQIVIISKGEVCFSGTTLQLKRDFDSGYQLKILKNIEIQTETQIKELIENFVTIEAISKKDMRDNEELIFELNCPKTLKLSLLFEELENRSNYLAINNISLGMTTFEDSYAKIVGQKFQNLTNESDNKNLINTDFLLDGKSTSNIGERNKIKKILRQILGIMIKRSNYMTHNYIIWLTLVLIPSFFLMVLFLSFDLLKQETENYNNKLLQINSNRLYGIEVKAFISSDDTNFTHHYSQTLLENSLTEVIVESDKKDLQDSLISYANRDLVNYFKKFLYGVSTNKSANRVEIWHNYNAIHSLPISLNLITNALLKQVTKQSDYHIEVSDDQVETYFRSSHPSRVYKHQFYTLLEFLVFMFGFTFTVATYVLLPITESRTKFKLLQMMSGLHPAVYWMANFLFDLTIHVICCFIYTSVYYIFDSDQYFIGSENAFISKYLMFFFYGISFIPFAYLVSFMFSKPSTGFTFIALYNLISCPIIFLLLELLHPLKQNYSSWLISILREAFVLVNPYVLFSIEINLIHQILANNNFCIIANVSINSKICEESDYKHFMCCKKICRKPFEENINWIDKYVIRQLISSTECYQVDDPLPYVLRLIPNFIIYGIIYFILILIIEKKFLRLLKQKIERMMKINKSEVFELENFENSDVRQEYESISQLVSTENYDNSSLIVHKLTKKLTKTLTIPNNISFMVNKEECFGLLGTNGSGKTTIFRLLTGDLDITSGNAYLGSKADLMREKTNFYSRIGYCPQNDALLDRLTGTQTLLFFGRIRGLETKALHKFIDKIIEKFELKSIIDKRLSTYSGGNRRKISLAIALMGTPRLLLLDEPTTGVDPESRLKIWHFLRQLMIESKVSILLTSHNMSECEALCSRLAIVSNGQIKTIGFIADLEKSYAKGFIIIVKVSSDSNVDLFKSKMIECFGDCCALKYENFGVIHYNLISDDINLSQIFHTLETIKSELNLEDYYVSNASLEQAFHTIVESDNSSKDK